MNCIHLFQSCDLLEGFTQFNKIITYRSWEGDKHLFSLLNVHPNELIRTHITCRTPALRHKQGVGLMQNEGFDNLAMSTLRCEKQGSPLENVAGIDIGAGTQQLVGELEVALSGGPMQGGLLDLQHHFTGSTLS